MIVAVGIFQALTIRPGHDWGDDFALYIAHARNLVEHRPYFDTGYIVNPGNVMIAPGPYPPVFPALLAPVYAVFGLDYRAMKLLIVACFVLALGAVDLALRDELSLPQRLALLALLGFSPYCTAFKNSVLSEFPFMLFVYLALAASRRIERRAPDGRPRWALGAALGVLMALAYGTRTAGIALPVALAASSWRKPAPVVRANLAALLVFASLFVVLGTLVPSGSSYSATLGLFRVNFPSFLVEVLRASARMLGRDLPSVWGEATPPFVTVPLTLAAGLLALVGYARAVRRGPRVTELFAAVFLAITFLWPALKDLRFYLPVLPLFFAYAFSGGGALLGELGVRPAARRALASAAAVVVAASFGWAYVHTPLRSPISPGVTDAAATDLFARLRARVPGGIGSGGVGSGGAAIVFPKPKAMALYTGRRSAAAHYTGDDAELLEYFEHTLGAACIVVPKWSQDMGPFLLGFAQRHPDRFDAEWAGGGEYLIFWFRRGSPRRAPGPPPPPGAS